MAVSRGDQRRLSDGVTKQITRLITGGSLSVGDKLPSEREMARTLGVSRPLVRESLRTLESLGLIEVRRGIGAIVVRTRVPDNETSPPPVDPALGVAAVGDRRAVLSHLERATILHILEAREILELGIVALASQRISEEEAEWLRRVAARAGSWDDNREFHIALASITHNFMLERLITMMFDLLADAHQRDHYASPETTDRLLQQHRDIAEAVIARDVTLAQDLLREHFQHTRQTIVWNMGRR